MHVAYELVQDQIVVTDNFRFLETYEPELLRKTYQEQRIHLPTSYLYTNNQMNH